MTKPYRCFARLAFRSARKSAFVASFVASFFATSFVATNAVYAANPLVIDTGAKQSLGSDTPYFYNTVTIKDGGTLSVFAAGTPNGTGRLHIKANRIIIEANATLDAKGVGNKGKSGGPGDGMGGGGFLAMSGGGGGAYFGNGGNATNAACATGAMFAAGGTQFGNVMNFGLGSAGGSGGAAGIGPLGAAGGGSIILEAAQIEVYGNITADGNNGIPISGVGSGGGAGGEVRLIAHTLLWGTKAKISAVGGMGGAATSSGGSGGGGLIYLRGGGTPPDPMYFDVAGGAPAAAGCAVNGGGAGVLDQDATMPMCPDLDGDGVAASLCAGLNTDCDDADPAINPSASEKCDGVDNDCNTLVDDGQTDCAAGLTCQNGKCLGGNVMDAGPEDGGTSAAPDTVGYAGGCTLGSASSTNDFQCVALVALALGAARRTRRSQRGKR